MKTFPSQLVTLKALTELVTAIIFHVSFQHISEMNDMVNIYGNVAGNPLALRKPVPTKVILFLTKIKSVVLNILFPIFVGLENKGYL